MKEVDHTHKLVGQEVVEPVVLERNLRITRLISALQATLTNLLSVQPLQSSNSTSRQNGRKWVLAEAWVKAWEGSDLDAESEDVYRENRSEFEHFLD